MSSYLCIDPGPETSGVVELYEGRVRECHKQMPNDELILDLANFTDAEDMAIEMIASYGMAVGKDVFETCVWIGRFIQRWDQLGKQSHRVYRKDVKMHLCQSPRAKDANIRQALIDRFGPGKDKAIGKKTSPGPLYGVSSHAWAALAVGVTFADQREAA